MDVARPAPVDLAPPDVLSDVVYLAVTGFRSAPLPPTTFAKLGGLATPRLTQLLLPLQLLTPRAPFERSQVVACSPQAGFYRGQESPEPHHRVAPSSPRVRLARSKNKDGSTVRSIKTGTFFQN